MLTPMPMLTFALTPTLTLVLVLLIFLEKGLLKCFVEVVLEIVR